MLLVANTGTEFHQYCSGGTLAQKLRSSTVRTASHIYSIVLKAFNHLTFFTSTEVRYSAAVHLLLRKDVDTAENKKTHRTYCDANRDNYGVHVNCLFFINCAYVVPRVHASSNLKVPLNSNSTTPILASAPRLNGNYPTTKHSIFIYTRSVKYTAVT